MMRDHPDHGGGDSGGDAGELPRAGNVARIRCKPRKPSALNRLGGRTRTAQRNYTCS
jgi:hypothetical protein